MDLKDCIAVVTGAARGLGWAMADTFAKKGAKIAIADRMGDALKKSASDLQSAGHTVLPVTVDITQASQVEAMVDKIEGELGPIDVMINCAGTFSVISPVWEADPERWFRDITVNLYGSFLCCRAAVKRMVQRKRGYVINVVSSGGVGDPHPYCTSYASSKTGLMRLTEGLAKEVEDYGIKVFALAPPAVMTKMTEFIMNDPGGKKWRPNFKKIFEEGHDSPPEAVAGMALNLVSGRADALSGRYFLVKSDFEKIVKQTEDILANDRLTLRIRA